MKKTLLFFLVFLLFAPFAGAQNGDPCLIVVLGSTTAEGAGASSPDSAWVNRYEASLSEKDTCYSVVNLAKGGYTTIHLLPTGAPPDENTGIAVDTNRNVTRALDFHPGIVIVNLPSNDVARGVPAQRQMANFETITTALRKEGVEVWVCTAQPRNFSDPAQVQAQREVRDAILSAYGDHAIDFWSGLAGPDGFILKEYDSGDGIHLNDAGHRLLWQRVMEKGIGF